MPFALTVLGCSSAMPAFGRHPSSHFLQTETSSMLLDCGEGCQFQLSKYRIKRANLNHIFITHLHGDHYFGLLGLVVTLALNNRQKKLTIYSPPGLKAIFDAHFPDGNMLPYQIEFVEVGQNSRFVINDELEVETVVLNHRIECYGYIFTELKETLNVKKECIIKHQLSVEDIMQLKSGNDLEKDGQLLKNTDLTEVKHPAERFAYLTDNRILPKFYEKVGPVDFLYHEATFLEKELERAKVTFHSTAAEAAALAKACGAKMLILGHYSARYKDLSPIESEAREIFGESYLGIEGERYSLRPF